MKKENNKKQLPSESSAKKVKIKVIGIGGGGGNIVSDLAKKLKDFSSTKIDFWAVNTDAQALEALNKKVKKFSFGQKLTSGLGTGREVAIGEKAAKDDLERIKSLFSDKKDLYIIVSSLGGGTGTGSSPVIARLASQMNLMTLGIFTLPFSFEGKKRAEVARNALEEMKNYLNAYMIILNEKIFSLTKEEISFTDSLNLLNDYLANSLEGLLRTIFSPGLINIDWADIKTILEGKKNLAYLNSVKVKGGNSTEELMKKLIKNPILDYNFEAADNIMFNIEGSSKDLSLQSISQISKRINEMAPAARIIFGFINNPKMKNEIKVTILSTGSGEEKKKKIEPKTKTGRTALEIKEAEEKEMEKEEEDEKIFEIPAFLRKEKTKKVKNDKRG